MSIRPLSLVIAAAVLAMAVPETAEACTCPPGVTANLEVGAKEVPLNIAPHLRGSFSPGEVTWQSAGGEPVAFSMRAGQGPTLCSATHAALLPVSPLLPNTEYVVRAKEGHELRFTTGTSNLPESPLPPPLPVFTLLHGNVVRDSCVTDFHGCFDVAGLQSEVTVLDAQGKQLNWFVTDKASLLERIAGEPACVEVRTRDAAGRTSEPLRLCGAELGLREAQRSDYQDYALHCVAGRIVPVPDGPVSGPPSQAEMSAAITDAGTARSEHDASQTADVGTAAPSPSATDSSREEGGCSLGRGPSSLGRPAEQALSTALALIGVLFLRRRRSA